jgi:hypothetical protein
VNSRPRHHSRRLLVALLLALGVPGCAMTFDSTSLGVPAVMAAAATQPVVGDTFQVTETALYGLWGAIPFRQPNLQATLETQLAGGRTVQNLRIHVRRRFWDVVLTALSAGLLDPVSVTFEGIITTPAP